MNCPHRKGLVWFALLCFRKILQQRGFIGARQLIEEGSFNFRLVIARGFGLSCLAQLVPKFGFVGHDLRIEPQEVPHLIERGAQGINGLGFRERVECLHQFRITGRLHGGAIQFALNGAQIVGDACDAAVKIVHASLVGHDVVCVSNISSTSSP
jgi:hypothetical protein